MTTKGLDFARAALALAVAGNRSAAEEWAASRWGRQSKAFAVTKDVVPINSTTSQTGLAGDYQQAASDFLELVRNESIIGRLPGLRRIPALIPYLKQTGSVSANWVGEGKPAPISNGSFTRSTIELEKLIAMTISTTELLEHPDSDRLLRDDLLTACVEALDSAFIDPDNSGTAGVKPASITDDITPITSTGTMKTDIETMVSAFGGNLSRAVFIGKPQLFVQLNGEQYPNIGARGGELAGIPAIASNGVPNDSGDDYQLVLVDPAAIAFAGMDTAYLKTSTEGTIEMKDSGLTQDGTDGTGVSLVSLWQTGGVAIAAQIDANWERQRDNSVILMGGIEGVESST